MSPSGRRQTGPAVVHKDRLDSWKEIASHLDRDVRTVQRWEAERGLPVHRVPGAQRGRVYASRTELDHWLSQGRAQTPLSRSEMATEACPSPPQVVRSERWVLSARTYVLGALMALSAYFVIVCVYVVVRRTEPVGWVTVPERSGTVLIEDVHPGSAAERAGIAPGDRILDWDSYQLYGFVRLRVIHAAPGHPYRLTVERNGFRRQVTLTLRGQTWESWLTRQGAMLFVVLATAVLSLVLAFVIVFSKPWDRAAFWGAGALSSGAFAMLQLLYFNGISGAVHLVRELPLPAGVLFIALGCIVGGSAPTALLTFAWVFPEPVSRNRLLEVLVWAVNAARVSALLYWWWILAYTPEAFSGLGWTADATDALIFPTMCCALGVLLWKLSRLREGNRARQLRVVMVGLAITLLAALPSTIFGVAPWFFVRRLTSAYEASWFPLFFSIFYPAAAAATAYAILRHRLFGIRVMIHQGIQYAAARRTVRSLAPLTVFLLIADLWLNRNHLLAETLERRWLVYFLVATAALVLHWRQKTWLERLDRRFFREQYDARRLLLTVAEEAGRTGTLQSAAPRVVAQIEAALHPEFAAVCAKQPKDSMFRAIAAARFAPPPFPADFKLVALLRLLEEPLDLSIGEIERDQLHLAPEETKFVCDNRVQWLFPVTLGPNSSEALLMLGPKRSEEPYSHEDQTLLRAIAANLALLRSTQAEQKAESGAAVGEARGRDSDGPEESGV